MELDLARIEGGPGGIARSGLAEGAEIAVVALARQDAEIVPRIGKQPGAPNVGAFSNRWTLQMTDELRFVFEMDNPSRLAEALRGAPADWPARNMQFVLHTKIVERTPGPPRVIAAHFWQPGKIPRTRSTHIS